MQWPVARITRSRRGTRPTTGRPSGVSGRGPRQICRTGPSAGRPIARSSGAPQAGDALRRIAHVPARQLQRAAEAQGVAQRREHAAGVTEVQRQLGEVRRPLHVDAVALGRLDGQRQPQARREGRRPGAGGQHDLVGDEVAAGRDDRDGARAGRLEGDGLGPATHLGAGRRRPVGHGAREARRVHVAVVREEEGAGELAAHAGEARGAPRRRRGRRRARRGRAPVGLRGGLVHGRSRLVGLDDAVAVVEPASPPSRPARRAARRCAACSACSTGAAGPRSSGVAAARKSQSQRSRAPLGRGAM